MRLGQSKVLLNLSQFEINLRCAVDTVLINQVCRAFLPRKILEIGFFQGQTLGLIAEAIEFDGSFVSVDLNFSRKNLFVSLFPEIQDKITYIQKNSANIVYDDKFDFICVDGDDRYESVINDLKTIFPTIHQQSILYMDAAENPGVAQAIKENLLGQHGLVPFLKGDQGMFFCDKDHSAYDFLNNLTASKFGKFMKFTKVDFYGHSVLQASSMPVFQENHSFFCLTLDLYNL